MSETPVFLSPELSQKAAQLQIDFSKIEESFIRGGGAGGQKINKTSSCVQLVYQPLNIVIRCQKHREREKNRMSAYKLLIAKVETIIRGKQSDQMKRIFKLRKQKQRRSRRSKEKMLEEKRRRGYIKEARRGSDFS